MTIEFENIDETDIDVLCDFDNKCLITSNQYYSPNIYVYYYGHCLKEIKNKKDRLNGIGDY